LRLEQLSQHSPCRPGAAARLDQEVQNFTFIVDRALQPMFFAMDLDDHIVEMPTGTSVVESKYDSLSFDLVCTVASYA
jgi:hypothetical protein